MRVARPLAIWSIALLISSLALSLPPCLHAENSVLSLDGQGDYVELPSDIFNDLDDATLEAWVKWDRFRYFSQPFGFGDGETWQVLAVNNGGVSPNLQFFLYQQLKLSLIPVPGILRLGEWIHLAAVTGRSGMKLYLNGVLVGEDPCTGSFSSLHDDGQNYFGRSQWSENGDFQGQLDEIRVWRGERTAEQIRATMFHKLGGDETGLMALWNFDAGDARDVAGDHDGGMHGDAHCVTAELPSEETLPRPAVLTGFARDGAGAFLSGADIQLQQSNHHIAKTASDEDGSYRFVLFPSSASYDLSATREELGQWKLDIRISPGEHKTMDMTLRPSVSISGTLTAYDNSLHRGMLVQVEERVSERESVQVSPLPSSHSLLASTLSDGSGRYRFINLKPGSYRVRCYVGDRYVYYGMEEGQGGRGEGEKTGKRAHATRNMQYGQILHVEPGQTLTDINLRFAPFKKGIWRTYTYLDGLASNRVYAITRDATGFLWFGTQGGVSRYDGKSFVSLTSEDGLAANAVRAIEVASDGTLWFGTYGGGLSHYDGDAFRNFTQADGLPGDRIRALCQDAHGILWIGTEHGLSRYDGQEFTNSTREDGLPSNRINAFCARPDGTLWIGTDKGLSHYDGKQFTNLAAFSDSSDNAIVSLHCDSGGRLWIGTTAGVWAYGGEQSVSSSPDRMSDKDRFMQFTVEDGLPNAKINAIAEGADGALWFAGNYGGVCRYDRQGFVQFTEQDGLANDKVETVYQDPDGLLWFGTRNGGVACYDGESCTSFTPQDGLPIWVSAITETAEGELWFGANDGAFRYDGERFIDVTSQEGFPQYGVYDIYQQSSGDCLWFGLGGGGIVRYDGVHSRVLTKQDGLAHQSVNAIRASRDGELWIGARAIGLSQLDTHTFTFRNWTEADGLRSAHIKAIYQDPSGLLWFGSQSAGVIRFDGERFDYLTTEAGLAANDVNAICQTADGTFWFGTVSGLSRYDGERFLNFTRKDGLVDDYVTVIHAGSDGKLWLGTDSGGVAIYDGVGWSSLDTRDGLIGNMVRSICEDSAGDLWFGTDMGATRYRRSPQPPKVRIVSVRTNRELSDLSSSPTITQGRRVSLSYQAIDFHTHPEKRLYRIQIRPMREGRAMASRKDEGASSIVTRSTTHDWIPERTGDYLLEVQAMDRDLNYSQPASLAFRVVPPWYLNGWLVFPSGGGILTLLIIAVALGHRTYVHRRESQRLRVQLLEQEREKNAQLQEAKQKAESARGAAELANQAKSVFLANMSHEIRTPLNAILGYAQLLQRDSDLLAKQRSAVETIEESGNHLLALINDVLDLSKIEAGRFELHTADFDLTQLIQGLSVMFELRCEQKGLRWIEDCRLEIEDWRLEAGEETPDPQRSNVPTCNPRTREPVNRIVHGDEGKLRQVLMNLLANAVKFTEEGSVTLRVGKCADVPVHGATDTPTRPPAHRPTGLPTFRFEVLDTGIGIPADEQAVIFEPFQQGESGFQAGGTGLGLAIAQRYVELMGGSLHVESEVGKGSCFFFNLALPRVTVPERGADSGSEVVRLAEGVQVKALVADDVLENRDILAQLLLDIGVQVQTAVDGGDALETIFREQPDIVFLDIRMPVIDGFQVVREVLARCEADANNHPPKLVAVSASAMIHEREQYREAGFDDFLAKPVRAEKVYGCLAQLLHIEYEMDESSDPTLDLAKLVLPEALLRRLRDAVGLGRIAELERALPELRKLGESGTRLAERLGELSRNLDMEQIHNILGVIRSEQEPDG